MISIIIPVFNEEESVATLHLEITTVLNSLNVPFEVIFIDDGSTDETVLEVRKLEPVHLIVFTRNFGKSQALQAGFRVAKGDYIFTMDGDLQDDPKEIPNFLEKIEKDRADLVCGWKRRRLDSLAKRLVSKVANGLTGFFTGTRVHDMNCGFKLYRREVAKSLSLYGDMHRYIPALVATQGFKISELAVNHRERKFGVSKYGNFRRFSKSFFDFVTLLLIRRFMDRPMHFFGVIGTIFSLFGFLVLAYLSFIKIFSGIMIGNRPVLMLGVLLVVIGIQLFSSGFLGELLIRQNNKQSLYTIREEVNKS
ncbi:MAG TPA: glycosyltransferase family 2 protein [Candidatus Paceibacterota bacterium]|nr:glycosyltransferase family 2 protein [Candidatus Paceibacterota bacterium]